MTILTKKNRGNSSSETNQRLNTITNDFVISQVLNSKLKFLQQNESTAQSVSQETNLGDLPLNVKDTEINDLDDWRSKRRAEIEFQRQLQKQYRQEGGDYVEVEEKNLLDLVIKSERVVCHFFLSEFKRCEVFDHHLKILALKHIQTRFVRINATRAPFLTEKLSIRVLPTLVVFLNGMRVKDIVGFTELGGSDSFKTALLEILLLKHKAIQHNPLCNLSSSSNDDSD